jgi:uncharacterized protein (TIGR02186 family)
MFLEFTLSTAVRNSLEAILAEYQPDVVVSVYPLFTRIISHILKPSQRPRLMTVVCDLGNVHRAWFNRVDDCVAVPTALVREKARRGPLWLNNQQRRFVEAPAFLATYTTRTIAEMGSEEDARRLRFGLRNRLVTPASALSHDDDEARFVNALIRLKAEDRLYQEVERGVTFLTPSLFRAAVELPASAPTGEYEVVIELFSGQVPLARQQTSFEVVQIGFEQRVAWLARNWALVYGLMTALTAIFFGWLATIIFRRD